MSSHPSAERHNQLIAKYYVPNMGDYSAAGSELSSILERLDANRALSSKDKRYLRDKGLFDLCAFVNNLEETGRLDFGILRAKFERQKKINIRRALWRKYGIDYVEGAHMRRMINLLLRVEKGDRISEKDVLWLTANDYFFPTLKQEYHKNEAAAFRRSFERNKNPWDAVNSSSHYRKADLPSEAASLLGKIDIESQRNKRLKGALYTTKGGSKRDLKELDEALQLAEKAHLCDPGSFHPCTLFGAIYYELGNYFLGDDWFAKAVERGAELERVDHELRSIFEHAGKAQQNDLKHHLLKIDPLRFDWVNRTKIRKKGKAARYNSKKPAPGRK